MSQTRREFLGTAAMIGAGGILGMSSVAKLFGGNFPGQLKGRKKNVLFIAVDDLRPELGCYGHPMVKSPNIDALAGNGVLFERTYCQQAVCGPTRASLLTGKRPDTTKIYDLKTHVRTTMPNCVTLQQHFKNNGYYSVGIGKLFHVGLEDEASYSTPHINGDGAFYVLEENLRLLKKGGKVTDDNGSNVESTNKVRMRAHPTECADVPDEAYMDGSLTELVIQSLNQLSSKSKSNTGGERQPFFIGVGFRKPHLPFCAPKKYWDLYDRKNIKLPYPDKPKNAPEIAFNDWAELRSYSDIPDVGPLDEATTRELIHGYYACVSFIDAQVGKLIAELDRLNLTKDTIVVVWGDHGWKLGEYSSWCKHTNFEIDTHVPMIIADPDLPKGVRTSALTEFVDIYPTLSELCGLPVADDLEGVSMVPLFSNPGKSWKKAAFSQYPRPNNIMGYSIRTDQYRYTEWIDQASREIKASELYDLKNDPVCKESIVLKAENKELVGKLHKMLEAGWKKAKPGIN